MRLRGFCLAILSASLLLGLICTSHANVIARDVAYWYIGDQGQIATEFNPDTVWLNANLYRVIVKVQQTVYDKEQTAQILRANGENLWDGYLFSYTVTNLNWIAAKPAGGIKAFGVNWGSITPLLVTTDHIQTNSGWQPYVWTAPPAPVSGPGWLWQPATPLPGIKIGSSVGGLWALSPIGTDGIVPAAAGTGDVAQFPEMDFIWGETTGPLPEPAGLLAVAYGTTALLLRTRKRR